MKKTKQKNYKILTALIVAVVVVLDVLAMTAYFTQPRPVPKATVPDRPMFVSVHRELIDGDKD